jgi:ribosomal protein L37AE/L43A
MDKMFCQSCQQMKPTEKMKLVVSKRKIWKCVDCIKRTSDAVYASKKLKRTVNEDS